MRVILSRVDGEGPPTRRLRYREGTDVTQR